MHGLHFSTSSGRSIFKIAPFRIQRVCRVFLLLGLLGLTLLLAACDSQGSDASATVTPALHSSQVQLSTPPPVATVTFEVYTGNGLSLSYPQTWVVRAAGTVVSLSDASGTYNMTVSLTANANGQKTADQLAKASLASVQVALNDPQHIAVPATVSLAGTTWSQQAVSGSTLSNGIQVEREVIVLATNHPASATSTRGVVLVYMGIKQSFAQARNTYFVPMLKTFKFLV